MEKHRYSVEVTHSRAAIEVASNVTMVQMALRAMLLVALAAISSGAQDNSRSRPTVAVRLVVNCNSKGASKPMTLEGTPTTFCLAPTPLANERDIVSAERIKTSKCATEIVAQLSESAGSRLLATTSQNIGNRLGIVVNGRLVMASSIRAPVSQGVHISGDLSEQEWNDLLRALNPAKQ